MQGRGGRNGSGDGMRGVRSSRPDQITAQFTEQPAAKPAGTATSVVCASMDSR